MRIVLVQAVLLGSVILLTSGHLYGQQNCTIIEKMAELESWGSESVEESHDGSVVFGQDRKSGNIKLWSAQTGRLINVLKPDDDTFAVGDRTVVSADGRILGARLKNRKTIWIGESESAQKIAEFSTEPFKTSFKTYMSPDGQHVLVGNYDKGAALWDATNGRSIGILRHAQLKDANGNSFPFLRAAFSPDSQTVATAYSGGIFVWDARDAGFVNRLNIDDKPGRASVRGQSQFYDLAFSQDGHFLAAGSRDGMARLWDVRTGELLYTFEQNSRVFRTVFSRDGKYLATVSYDRKDVRMWELATGRLLYNVRSIGARPWTVTFSTPEVGLVSIVVADGIEFRSIASGELIQRCPKTFGYFLSSGSTFVVGSETSGVGLYRTTYPRLQKNIEVR